MISLASIIGGVLIGYLLGPLFMLAHKKIIGRKMIYGIQNKPKPEIFKDIFLKGFFPSLMAMNFALLFAFDPAIQRIAINNSEDAIAPMLTFNVLLALMIGISMGLFSPVWFLLDAGIVYSNKEKVKDTSYPTEVRSVGGWFMPLLKGYAGISVILSFYTFFLLIYNIIGPAEVMKGMNLMFLILYPILPFVITIVIIPAFIVLDLTYNHRKKFILKQAKKLGINGPLQDPLDIR
jgi:hypothetical protein